MANENQAKASRPMSDHAHRTFATVGVKESNIPRIDGIKEDASYLWDQLNLIPSNPENGRMIALAKTKLEEAVMWGVKACSRA